MTNEEAIKAIKANYPSGGYEDLCEALDIAIKALSEPIWHPYPQDKPTEEKSYLVTREGAITGNLYEKCKYFWEGFVIGGVIAWAELPKPYEEGAEE